jgi:hypothetical protein
VKILWMIDIKVAWGKCIEAETCGETNSVQEVSLDVEKNMTKIGI